MVRDSKLRWSGCVPGQLAVLPRHILGSGAQHHEHIHYARLEHPECVHLALAAGEPALAAFLHINPALGCVEPEQTDTVFSVVRHHEGDAGIESHWVP